MIPKEDYYKKVFLTGAIWNILATTSTGFLYETIFSMNRMDLPRYPVFLLLFAALAFIFGIGYFWVYRDLHDNHAIVKLGIAGKLMVFILLLKAGLSGEIKFSIVLPGVVDLVYAILYLEFLMTYKKCGAVPDAQQR